MCQPSTAPEKLIGACNYVVAFIHRDGLRFAERTKVFFQPTLRKMFNFYY